MEDLLGKNLLDQVHSAVEYFDKVSNFAKSQPTTEVRKTAVEWLQSKVLYIVPSSQKDDLLKLFEQAKQMEKEQIIDAYNQDLYGGLNGSRKFDNGAQYYNDMYEGHFEGGEAFAQNADHVITVKKELNK